MLKWKQHTPQFEFVAYEPELSKGGHLQLIYDLVRNTKPHLMVELGSAMDGSFFSMCQAIKDDGFPAQAVTVGKGADFNTLRTIRDYYYKDIGHLVHSNFNEAVSLFIDESIDLLQLDSGPAFIRQDYELWLKKVKPGGGVVINNIFEPGIGSFWGDMKRRNPSLEFKCENGLGIVFPKGVPPHLLQLVLEDKQRIQTIYGAAG